MLTLYQFELSPFCDKVRRILRFKAVPFEVREVSLLKSHKHSPTRKLPCIELDGERIDDSTQIAHFLERRFPEPPLIPSTPRERALCHVLEDWADESLYFYEVALHFSLPENVRPRLGQLVRAEKPVEKAILNATFARILRTVLFWQGTGRRSRERILEDVGRHMQAVSALLGESQYLLGNTLTLADISVFCELDAMCITEPGRLLCARHPNLLAWRARVRQQTGG